MALTSIGLLASGIFTYDLESNSGIASQFLISGWLQENYAGIINTNLYKSHTGINPNLDVGESQILRNFYLSHFYQRQAQKTKISIAGIGSSNILSIKEADTSISFVNQKELAREFAQDAKEYQMEAYRLIGRYNEERMQPLQVVGLSALYSGSYGYSFDRGISRYFT